MTTSNYKTPHELANAGFDILLKQLGPGGAIGFLHQYEKGEGDYTRERKRILKGFSLSSIRSTSSRRA